MKGRAPGWLVLAVMGLAAGCDNTERVSRLRTDLFVAEMLGNKASRERDSAWARYEAAAQAGQPEAVVRALRDTANALRDSAELIWQRYRSVHDKLDKAAR